MVTVRVRSRGRCLRRAASPWMWRRRRRASRSRRCPGDRTALGHPGQQRGTPAVRALHEFPSDRFEYPLRVMLLGPATLTRAALPTMYAARWGRIVNMGSIHSVVASPNKSAYVAAKHGLLGLTRTVALEAGPYGVTVNCVRPRGSGPRSWRDRWDDLARTEGKTRAGRAGHHARTHGHQADHRAVRSGWVVSLPRSDAAGSITGSVQMIGPGAGPRVNGRRGRAVVPIRSRCGAARQERPEEVPARRGRRG